MSLCTHQAMIFFKWIKLIIHVQTLPFLRCPLADFTLKYNPINYLKGGILGGSVAQAYDVEPIWSYNVPF